MGVCDSCFTSTGPENEYEPITSGHPAIEVPNTKPNESAPLLQSYQQQGVSQVAPAASAVSSSARPPNPTVGSQVRAAGGGVQHPTPAVPAATASAATTELDNGPNAVLHDVKSQAPAVSVGAPVPSNTPGSVSGNSAGTAAAPSASAVSVKTPAGTPAAAGGLDSYDPTSGVFEGLELLQKFTNKSSYDTRFIWINIQTNTMHMSQYMTKDRRHKEASLYEVTSVVEAAPEKVKSTTVVDLDLCLTINFKRGGGIDLVFKNPQDRDEWSSVLRMIIANNQQADAPQPQ